MVWRSPTTTSVLTVKSKQLPLWAFFVDLPSWRGLILTAMFFSFALLVTTIVVFHNAKYSPLNRSVASQTRALHDYWLHSASTFFSTIPSHNFSRNGVPSGGKRFAIGGKGVNHISTALIVMASKRRAPYIQAWAWSLLSGSSARELNQTAVTILNTERPSSSNRGDLQPLVDAGIQVVDMYPGEDDAAGAGFRPWSQWILDEYLCHIEALKACDKAGAPWCIIFEEDSLLTRGFLMKFKTVVIDGAASHASELGMVKLFTTDAWQGFEWPFWLKELILIPVCLAALLVTPVSFLITRVRRIFFSKRRRHLYTRLPSAKRSWNPFPGGKVVFIFVVVLANIIIFAVLASRQRVMAWFQPSRVQLVPCPTAAFTVAVAFPLETTWLLRDHMQKVVKRNVPPTVPVDLEIFAWAAEYGFSVLQTSPSIAQHIGILSSNPLKAESTYVNQDSRFTF